MLARRISALAVLAMAAATFSLLAAPVSRASADAPVWLEDYKAAITAARDSGKPIFLVFRCVP